MVLDFCISRHSGAVSLEGGLGKVRGREVEIGLEMTKAGRLERRACLRKDIVVGRIIVLQLLM